MISLGLGLTDSGVGGCVRWDKGYLSSAKLEIGWVAWAELGKRFNSIAKIFTVSVLFHQNWVSKIGGGGWGGAHWALDCR